MGGDTYFHSEIETMDRSDLENLQRARRLWEDGREVIQQLAEDKIHTIFVDLGPV